MPKAMDIEILGDRIKLKREQWKGNDAYISNYPGLLEEVKKHTWTYTDNKHPYLSCSAISVSLHKFVLQFLYGKEKLDEMIGKSNIIEHLDNNGLNCVYENLHVLSEDWNKVKAFSIDKKNAALEAGEIVSIPALITDVYYSHKGNYFQLQVYSKMYGMFYELFSNKYVKILDVEMRSKKYRALLRVTHYVDEHYSDGVSLEEVAEATGISRYYVSHLFKELMDNTFVGYVNELRLNHAAMLLTTTDSPIIEIASKSGFNNLSNFNRAFKMYFGKTPSAYRKGN